MTTIKWIDATGIKTVFGTHETWLGQANRIRHFCLLEIWGAIFYEKLLNMLLWMLDIKCIRLSIYSGSKCAFKSQRFLFLWKIITCWISMALFLWECEVLCWTLGIKSTSLNRRRVKGKQSNRCALWECVNGTCGLSPASSREMERAGWRLWRKRCSEQWSARGTTTSRCDLYRAWSSVSMHVFSGC